MAAATRRSDIACNRSGFNPLKHEFCLGKAEDRKPCQRQVLHQLREIAYYMLGQGAHLFSDSGELRGILTEAADLLYCCRQHRDSDELVRKWLVNWKKREKTDLAIHRLVQQRIREKKPVDLKWQVAFENHMGQLARYDVADSVKLQSVKHAIWEDEFHERRNLHSARMRANLFGLRIGITEPEPLHLAGANAEADVQQGVPVSSLTSLPTNVEEDAITHSPLATTETAEPSVATSAETTTKHKLRLPWKRASVSSQRPSLDTVMSAGESSGTAAARSQSQETKTMCEICVSPFDKKKVWRCPDCANKIHLSCFNQWNLQSIPLQRPTTCPYCRSVVRFPLEF